MCGEFLRISFLFKYFVFYAYILTLLIFFLVMCGRLFSNRNTLSFYVILGFVNTEYALCNRFVCYFDFMIDFCADLIILFQFHSHFLRLEA